MRVCCISDTHTYHNEVELPECDLLLHAGDFTFTGKREELTSFNHWLGEQKSLGKFKHAIIIPGNHELTLDPNHPEGRYKAFAYRKIITNAEMLIDEVTHYEGLKIYGSPDTLRFFDWAFNRSAQELRAKWNATIPNDVDIVMIHGPAYGVGDTISRNSTKGNLGDIAISDRLAEINPMLYVCGHIHGGYGIYTPEWCKGTIFANAASVDELYNPGNPPILFNIDVNRKEITW